MVIILLEDSGGDALGRDGVLAAGDLLNGSVMFSLQTTTRYQRDWTKARALTLLLGMTIITMEGFAAMA